MYVLLKVWKPQWGSGDPIKIEALQVGTLDEIVTAKAEHERKQRYYSHYFAYRKVG